MPTKRAGAIAALLVTALLLCAMPGLLARLKPGDGNRMDERLRPARLHTLTVWLMPDDLQDKRLLAALCTAYEKQTPGARVFLRSVSEDEWMQPQTVLPDVVLFGTGAIHQPRSLLRPLTGLGDEEASAGCSGGVCYAAPLWLSPNVLVLPSDWAGEPSPTPLFGLDTPDEAAEEQTIPWDRVTAPGGLTLPEGVALQQLLLAAPAAVRQNLRSQSRGAARVTQLCQLKDQTGRALTPVLCDRVRYAGLCGDDQQGRDFLAFLLQNRNRAAASGYLPYGLRLEGDSLPAALSRTTPVIPNAFAHTRQELNALCLDAFRRGQDPVETMLRLQ